MLALDSVEALLAPHERPRLQAMMQARHRGEPVPSQYEYDGLRQDGSSVHLLNIVRRVQWDGEEAIPDHVDRHHRAETRRTCTFRDKEARFRDLVEGSIQGIYVHRDYKPFFVNHAFVTMLGY